MTEREFCVWLSGVLECRKELDLREPHDYAATVALVESKLRALLAGEKSGGADVQAKLNAAHAVKEGMAADLFKPRLYHDGAD